MKEFDNLRDLIDNLDQVIKKLDPQDNNGVAAICDSIFSEVLISLEPKMERMKNELQSYEDETGLLLSK